MGIGQARDLLHGCDVAAHIARDLLVAAARERARLHPLVAVQHVDRQEPRDVGPVDRAAPASGGTRAVEAAEAQLAAVPVAHGVDEGPLGGVAVLAEQVHVVAQRGHRFGQARVVDVGSGPLQQIPVEDQDPHRPQAYPALRQLR